MYKKELTFRLKGIAIKIICKATETRLIDIEGVNDVIKGISKDMGFELTEENLIAYIEPLIPSLSSITVVVGLKTALSYEVGEVDRLIKMKGVKR